jgi:chromatin segregation and condensation protein Rec8/ScpA/Scc1 (kleisin family)
MIQAQDCRNIQQSEIYTDCMQQVNNKLKKSIAMSKQTKLQKYRSKKASNLSKNIDQQIKNNLKKCMNEQTQLSSTDNMNNINEKRHLYCIYENMLELLINIEGNIRVYSS